MLGGGLSEIQREREERTGQKNGGIKRNGLEEKGGGGGTGWRPRKEKEKVVKRKKR